jgi:hypothetical protein
MMMADILVKERLSPSIRGCGPINSKTIEKLTNGENKDATEKTTLRTVVLTQILQSNLSFFKPKVSCGSVLVCRKAALNPRHS